MTATLNLETFPGRCPMGFAEVHHPHFCNCSEFGEFVIFVRALKAARDESGLISQTRVRPLIQAIPHKHRGRCYRRAKSEGLIERAGKEPSTDAAGKNTDKDQTVYRWIGVAA